MWGHHFGVCLLGRLAAQEPQLLDGGLVVFFLGRGLGVVARGPFLGPCFVCVLVFLFDGVAVLGGLGFSFCWFCRGCCGTGEVAEGDEVWFLL